MTDNTKIEWADATINAINGCDPISPGCANCYAMRSGGRNLPNHPSTGLTAPSKAGHVWTGEVRLNEKQLVQPLRWKKPRRIFWNAHGDMFHENVPDEWIADCIGVAIAAHHINGHVSLFLTKRSKRQRELLNTDAFWDQVNCIANMHVMERVDPLNRRSDDARATLEDYGPHNPPPGIWLGVSVEDQTRADERIPDLLATPAAVRFLSCEPLLGPVDLTYLVDKIDSEIIALDGNYILYSLDIFC